MKTLLITADDMGLHPDINDGILECAQKKRISNISISANGKFIPWKELLQCQEKGIKLGVHITLVGEEWLTQNYCFEGYINLFQKLLRSPSLLPKIEKEIEAQLEILLKQGIVLQHIDSHQNIHPFPKIWSRFVAIKRKYNIPRIRTPFCPSFWQFKLSISGFALHILSKYTGRKETAIPCIGIRQSGKNHLEIIKKEIATCKQKKVEMVVHPGNTTSSLQQQYSTWGFQWTQEKDMLLSEDFSKVLDQNNFRIGMK